MNYFIRDLYWSRLFSVNFKMLVNNIVLILCDTGFHQSHILYDEITKMKTYLEDYKNATEKEFIKSEKRNLNKVRNDWITYIVAVLRNNLKVRIDLKRNAAHSLWIVFEEVDQNMTKLDMISESEQINILLQRWDNKQSEEALALLQLEEAYSDLQTAHQNFEEYFVKYTAYRNRSKATNAKKRADLTQLTKEVLCTLRVMANLKNDAQCITALKRINVLIAEENRIIRSRITRQNNKEAIERVGE